MNTVARDTAIGSRALRLEDGRLLRGKGRFVDDVDLPGQRVMRVVRATVAHARIRSVDTAAAAAAPGVHLALSAADLAAVHAIPLRLDFGVELTPYLQQVLARDRVRYVGEPVAIVLAEDAYLAEDAADLVAVAYEPLPAVLDAQDGLCPGTTQLRDDADNEVVCLCKRFGDVEEAFGCAEHVVRAELRTGRHTGVPLETRGLIAAYDAGVGT